MTAKSLSFILIILLVISLCGCNKHRTNKNEINKIEIATGGCLRGCPVIGLIIDSALNYSYYGGEKAKLRGYFHGEITPELWDSLNLKLKKINFKEINSEELGLDGENAEVIFYWGNNKKHLFKSIYGNHDSVSNVLIWIINSYKHIRLNKSSEQIRFNTTYQFMKAPMPRPKLDNVKFPPPGKD